MNSWNTTKNIFCNVTLTLAFDHWNPVTSLLSTSEHLCQICQIPLWSSVHIMLTRMRRTRSQWPWPLAYDYQKLFGSSMSPGGHWCQIWRTSLEVFLRYCVPKDGTDGQPENIMPLSTAIDGIKKKKKKKDEIWRYKASAHQRQYITYYILHVCLNWSPQQVLTCSFVPFPNCWLWITLTVHHFV